jgi:outer membrane immunogenic protein
MTKLAFKSISGFAVAVTLATSGSATAADYEPVSTPLDVYAGVFGGVLFADRDVVSGFGPGPESYEDSFGTAGGLAGINVRHGSMFYGVEGDFGFVFGSASYQPSLVCPLRWCDADWKAHVRGRVGFATGQLDLFVAGGLAIAELGGAASSQTVAGFTVGGGVETALSDAMRARVEILYDEFDQNGLSGEPSYQGKWSDITVRGALLFNF